MRRLHVLLLALAVLLLDTGQALGEDEFSPTAAEIIELKAAGIEDGELLEALRETGTRPAFTPAQLEALERAGAGPELLAYLRARPGQPTPAPAPTQAPEDPPEPRAPIPPKGPPTRPGGGWTPAVWKAPDLTPTDSAPDRSLAVIGTLSDLYLAYVNTGRYVEAGEYFESYLHMAQAHGFPPWAQTLAAFNLAATRLRLGQVEAGLAALGAAADLGFADPYSFQEDVPRSLWEDRRVRDAYGRMAIEPADLHEIEWIRTELQAMEHDSRLFIIANANRVDHAWTQVARVAVPARPTRSVAIEGWRAALRYVQRRQQFNVMASDQMRKTHLTRLQIMGQDGASDGERFASRQLAERRESEQADSVAAREYRPSAAPTGGRVLPALGSLGVEQTVAPAVAPVRSGEGSARSAWIDVQAGDWWESRVTITAGEEVVGRSSIREWVTARSGALTSSILIRKTPDATTVEDNFSRVLPTNREQVEFDLSQQGPVEVEHYAESETSYELRGRGVPARRIVMRFQWTRGGERETWTLEGIVAPEICRGACLEVRLQSATQVIHQRLVAWGR